MDLISGQKEPTFHKNDIFDLPDRQTAVSFSLGSRGWVGDTVAKWQSIAWE